MNVLRSQFQFRTFGAAYRWWRTHLTLGGKTLTLTLLAALPGVAVLDAPLVVWFSAQLALLLVVGATHWWMRPRVQVSVGVREMIRCGEWTEVRVCIVNASRRAVCDLVVQWHDLPVSWESPSEGVQLQLAGGESRQLGLAVRPLRRGQFTLPAIRTASSFPLNLFRLSTLHRSADVLLVAPPRRSLEWAELTSLTAATELGDEWLGQIAAVDGTEYLGSREYVPGLPVRRWDYGSWARLGQPVVREFSAARQSAATLWVDSQLGVEAKEEADRLEAILALAAAVSETLASGGIELRWLGLGDRLLDGRAAVGESPHDSQHAWVLRQLALAVPAEAGGWERLRDRCREASLGGALHIVILGGWSDARREVCDELEARGGTLRRLLVDASDWSGEQRPDERPGDVRTTTAAIQAGEVAVG